MKQRCILNNQSLIKQHLNISSFWLTFIRNYPNTFYFPFLNQKIINQVIWGEKQFFSNESLDIFLNQTAEISAIIFK